MPTHACSNGHMYDEFNKQPNYADKYSHLPQGDSIGGHGYSLQSWQLF
jgi:hypothetical protein